MWPLWIVFRKAGKKREHKFWDFKAQINTNYWHQDRTLYLEMQPWRSSNILKTITDEKRPLSPLTEDSWKRPSNFLEKFFCGIFPQATWNPCKLRYLCSILHAFKTSNVFFFSFGNRSEEPLKVPSPGPLLSSSRHWRKDFFYPFYGYCIHSEDSLQQFYY